MQVQIDPANPVTAVTHPDPYPYYAELVSRKPIYYDRDIGCWVVSSADAVHAILTSDICRVRPPTEPVPAHIAKSSTADIFRHLVRMNDGDKHQPFKYAVSSALASSDPQQVALQAERWSQTFSYDSQPARLTDFIFQLPIYTVAILLGLPENRFDKVACWISEYLVCLAPSASPEQLEQGKTASSEVARFISYRSGSSIFRRDVDHACARSKIA